MDKELYRFPAGTLVSTRCYPETQFSVLFDVKSLFLMFPTEMSQCEKHAMLKEQQHRSTCQYTELGSWPRDH